MDITINHNIRFLPDSRIEKKLDEILSLLTEATIERNHIMATLQDIQDAVNQQANLVQQVKAEIDDLKAKVAAIPGLTPEQQAQIDDIFAKVQADNAVLQGELPAA